MTIHELINILIVNRRSIIRITILGMILIFVYLFLIAPRTYKSIVSILPPEKNKDLSGLGNLLAGQDVTNLLGGSASSANSQLFIEMLKSRTAAEYVVIYNGLKKYYSSDNVDEAAIMSSDDLQIELTKEGIIKLSFAVRSSFLPMFFDKLDTLKRFSAKVSNSYVEALDKINREKLSSKAKKAREYIEQQLVITRAVLDSTEGALMNFQKVNKTISLPEQVQAAIDAAANIRTEIVKTEIEIGLLGANLRQDNKNLMALKEKLNELQNQYSRMEMGNQDYLLSFKEVPSLGRQLSALLRDVKIQNELYLLLQQQYYKEKIQETRDLPTVDVLDPAIPPLKASEPRVLFSTVTGGIFVFLGISFITVLKNKKFTYIRKKDV